LELAGGGKHSVLAVIVRVVGGNNKNKAAGTFCERAASKMGDHLQPWQDFVHSDAEAMGSTATAYDTSLRVCFNDDRKLRLQGQVTVQHNVVSGEIRIAYYGQQVDFHSGNPLRLTLSSSLLLPHPSEWLLGNTQKAKYLSWASLAVLCFKSYRWLSKSLKTMTRASSLLEALIRFNEM
jgi:hypothetical protein